MRVTFGHEKLGSAVDSQSGWAGSIVKYTWYNIKKAPPSSVVVQTEAAIK
jgi:hypothetical protein